MAKQLFTALLVLTPLSPTGPAAAFGQSVATAGSSGGDDLVIAQNGQPAAIVVASPLAGPDEKLAAADLVKYVAVMTGAKLTVAHTDAAAAEALKSDKPLLVLGTAALAAEASLADALARVLKKNPELSPAITMRPTTSPSRTCCWRR